MNIETPFSTKSLEQTVPGELVAFQNTGDVGFVISKLPDGKSHIGILRSTDERSADPHWTVYSGDTDCVSYGTDWIFEIVARSAEDPFLTGDARYAHGACFVTADDVFILLRKDPSNIRTSESYVNLRTLKGSYAPPAPSSAAVGRWQIWLNAKDRDSGNREPFLRLGF